MNFQATFSFRNGLLIFRSFVSPLFVYWGTNAKRDYFFPFLFFSFLLLPILSSAQEKAPILTLKMIQQLKESSGTVFPIKKQILPFKDKVMVRFPELGTIYNPTFPKTRHRITVANFRKEGTNYTYIGKSLSTFRASLFLRNEGIFYGVWQGGNCCSLIEYEVNRVGANFEITGKVYSCLIYP